MLDNEREREKKLLFLLGVRSFAGQRLDIESFDAVSAEGVVCTAAGVFMCFPAARATGFFRARGSNVVKLIAFRALRGFLYIRFYIQYLTYPSVMYSGRMTAWRTNVLTRILRNNSHLKILVVDVGGYSVYHPELPFLKELTLRPRQGCLR